MFKDTDGKLYITWKAYGLTEGRDVELLASELSPDGLSLIGEHFSLTDHSKGWKKGGDEGQVLLRRGEYYYLFYSDGGCCDNMCDYRILVARSKNLRSGWKQNMNPIIEGGRVWRCPGHGTFVTTKDNRYFYLYHSYNAFDFEFIGRQGLLEEMLWNDGTGWPYFEKGITPSEKNIVPFEGTVQKRDSIRTDYFNNENLQFLEWDMHFTKPEFEEKDNTFTIKPRKAGITFAGFRPEVGDYFFEAKIELADNFGGIGIYTHQTKNLAIMANKSELIISKLDEVISQILFKQELNSLSSIYLKYYAVNAQYFIFEWSEDGKKWQSIRINRVFLYNAKYLSQWGYSPRAGIILDGKNAKVNKFSNLKVTYSF